MNRINSRTHGAIDYIVGFALLLAPYLFRFAEIPAARNVAWFVGGAIILMSLVTAYELSIAKLIPFRAHVAVDLAMGVFLALSPWIFGFSQLVIAPHLIVGLLILGVALMSRSSASLTDDHHFPHSPTPARH
jgi:urea transporter